MKVLLAAIALCLGCATTQQAQIRLPQTPEAMACARECMMLDQSCSNNVTATYFATGNPWVVAMARGQCNQQHYTCLGTCPGACADNGEGCWDAYGRNLVEARKLPSEWASGLPEK